MSAIQEWRQEEVVQEVSDEVERNMETAAKMVEVDARRNLLKIRDPEWGIAYRKLLAFYRLTSVVTRDTRAISAGVGMPPGKQGSDYGYWIEVGSRSAPAHPWLRPALCHNLRNILRLLSGT